MIADATRLDTFYHGKPLKVTYDTGQSIVGRNDSCMSLENFEERILLVKQPLGSGKSYQARNLHYDRVCWITSTRALAAETCRVSGFANYQNIPHSTPLSWVDKVVVLIPSLHRMSFKFKKYSCLVIDEAESCLQDMFSGLVRGPKFEAGMECFKLLMETSDKILLLDGFLKNSALSVAVNYAQSLDDIRLVLARYKINRGAI